METPHLDKAIEQLKGLAERVPVKEVTEKLQEYKAIKEALSIHSVSDMFSFAKYLKENYDYHDNTEDGDIYIHKGNKLKYTEDKIYLTWSNYR